MSRPKTFKPMTEAQKLLQEVHNVTSFPGGEPVKEAAKAEPNDNWMPSYPPNITEAGEKSSYRAWCETIRQAGVMLVEADKQAIGRLVKIYLRILHAEQILKSEGTYYDAETIKPTGEVHKMKKKHPARNDLAADEKEFRILLTHFGLTPLSRQNLKEVGNGKKIVNAKARDKLS